MSSHDDQDWGGGWQVDMAAKRAAWGATTPAQRPAWLESALTLAQSVGALDHDREQREGEAMEWLQDRLSDRNQGRRVWRPGCNR